MVKNNKYKGLIFTLVIFLVSLGIMAPISSNKYLPNISDFANHTALIVQAKKALFTGDFPLRVAPIQHHGFSYPVYQFYSPFPYTISAIVYGIFFSSNPFLALKFMYWLCLMIGGLFMYKTGAWISKSREVGGIVGVAYILSPYFLINILARSAFTEAFALGLIPVLLFHSLKYLDNEQFEIKSLLWICLLWFLLATTHLITFLYTAIFFSIFWIGLLIFKLQTLKKAIIYFLAFFYSWLMFAWFIIPILLFKKDLHISLTINDIYNSNWLTPISELFSFTAVSMMPLPGNRLLESEIYPAIGWLYTLSYIGLGYVIFSENSLHNKFNHKFIKILLILFVLAIFITWSPFNFWKLLPNFLQVAQFTYRFLSQVMWIGCLGLAVFLSIYWKKNNILLYMGSILLILNTNSSWNHTLKSSSLTVEQVITNPDIGYGAGEFLLNKKNHIIEFGGNLLPVIFGDGWLLNDKVLYLDKGFYLNNHNMKLHFSGNNFLKIPTELTVEINGEKIFSKTISPGLFDLDVPLYTKINNDKKIIELKIHSSRYFIPNHREHNSQDMRHLSIIVNEAYLTDLKFENNILSAEEVRKNCYLNKISHRHVCEINLPSTKGVLQLPLLYYPKMLLIEVDGKREKIYYPTSCGDYHCASINLKQGKHLINFKFIGLSWANWLSFFSLIIFILFWLYLILKKDKIAF